MIPAGAPHSRKCLGKARGHWLPTSTPGIHHHHDNHHHHHAFLTGRGGLTFLMDSQHSSECFLNHFLVSLQDLTPFYDPQIAPHPSVTSDCPHTHYVPCSACWNIGNSTIRVPASPRGRQRLLEQVLRDTVVPEARGNSA